MKTYKVWVHVEVLDDEAGEEFEDIMVESDGEYDTEDEALSAAYDLLGLTY